LRLQREDGHERNRDDEQGVEERRIDFDGRVADDIPMRLLPAIVLDVLVRVLNHDDDRIDHRADGDGDSA